MTFVSFAFVIFCAVTACAYFLVPRNYRWAVLLVASYVFYWINSHWLVLVLLAATLITYYIGQGISDINARSKQKLSEGAFSREEKKAIRDEAKKKAGTLLTVGIILDLGMLLFLKYFNFFAENVNGLIALFGVSARIPGHHLLLPLGISFYTLQAIAYMVDISRGKYEADRHLGKFMLFMSFFPQIVQGPIARHNQLAEQLYEGHAFDYTRLCHGIQLMMWGWIKKMIIADRVDIPVSKIFNNYAQYRGPIVFFAAALYGVQVYSDFSGGMDIARGFAQILGIEMELNFRQPYFSTSIEEFWRRWHITLGSWMRDYIFYPLSLSKAFGNLSKKTRNLLGQFVGKRLPSFLAMFIVYLLVGFWHGSSWKYVAYGIWNGVFIMSGILLEEVYGKMKEKAGVDSDAIGWRVFQMVRTFLIVSAGRILSKALSLRAALGMFRNMFMQWWDVSYLLDGSLKKLGLDTANWFLLAVFILILFLVDYVHEKDVRIRETISQQYIIFRWIIYIAAILAILVFGIYGPEYDAASFIYEQF